MQQSDLEDLVRQNLTLTNNGDIVVSGDGNVVTPIQQQAGDYAIQIGELHITLPVDELRRILAPEITQELIPGTPQWDAALDRYREWVKRTYGTMRVLGKHKPVSVEGIYTDVYMLEKPAASRYRDPQGGLIATRGKRQDGLRLVMQPGNEHIVVLGQPGAGKTTFLKHIAMKAAEGRLGDYVPILVYLREWTGGDLMEFLIRPLTYASIADPHAFIENLLQAGRALLLLDGLDEVNEPQRRDLIRSMEEFHRCYADCRMLLTCRVAATPHQFEGFSEVEVADFTGEDILAFARNWFGENTPKAREFQNQIQQDERLRDLGRNPLLLGILCLTFDEQGEFPQKRAELYQRGLDALLVEWDESRSIEREAMCRAEIYHNLSLGRKHQLFAHIAYATFEQGEILLPRERVERLLTDYLVTIPNAPACIDIDSAAILEAIEAQHGILVEHARGVYAFLHSTFQEYYAACYVAAQAKNGDVKAIPHLLTHIYEDYWREVILLTGSILSEADGFFVHFLDALDALVRDDTKLADFLTWAQRKATAVAVHYKPAAVRAWYAYHALDSSRVPEHALTARNLLRDLDLTLANPFGLALDCDDALTLDCDDALFCALDRARYHDYDRDSSFYRALDRAHKLNLEALKMALNSVTMPPGPEANRTAWDAFIGQLQALMIANRDIGHDWSFDDEQLATLNRYFTAAHLLVNCLDVAHVTDRAAIEDRLLLPPKQDTTAGREED